MTAPSSPASSEVAFSSSCTTTVEDSEDTLNSTSSSPELKRVKRQTKRSIFIGLDGIFNRRRYPFQREIGREKSDVLKETPSKMSFKSADDDVGFEESLDRRSRALEHTKGLCCSLPDITNIGEPINECRGLEIGYCCMGENYDRNDQTQPIVSSKLKSYRKHKVLSSYYSHFKQNSNRSVEENNQNVIAALEDVCESFDRIEDNNTEETKVKNTNISDVLVTGENDPPDVYFRHPIDFTAIDEVHSNIFVKSLDQNPVDRENVYNPIDTVVDIVYPHAETPANDQFSAARSKPKEMGNLEPSTEYAFSDMDNRREVTGGNPGVNVLNSEGFVTEKTNYECADFRRLGTNTEKLLRSCMVEKQFKNELEFSTILTLAYVRVRDLTNSIDKSLEFLASIDKNDDSEDADELRDEIQTLFDSRANLALEREKWRSRFTCHYRQRKTYLANLKSRANRAEYSYFQLNSELLQLEREPVIIKPKRSWFSKIFSFGFFVKK